MQIGPGNAFDTTHSLVNAGFLRWWVIPDVRCWWPVQWRSCTAHLRISSQQLTHMQLCHVSIQFIFTRPIYHPGDASPFPPLIHFHLLTCDLIRQRFVVITQHTKLHSLVSIYLCHVDQGVWIVGEFTLIDFHLPQAATYISDTETVEP